MCYAYRFAHGKNDNGDYMSQEDLYNEIYDEKLKLETKVNNTFKQISDIETKITTAKKELEKIIQKYDSTVQKYSNIGVLELYDTSDIILFQNIPYMFEEIKYRYSDIKRLENDKKKLEESNKRVAKSLDEDVNILYKRYHDINTILQPQQLHFNVQYGGNDDFYRHKYLKYKMKYLQLTSKKI